MSEPTNAEPDPPRRRATSWAAHWHDVGRKLDAVRRHELRNFDHQRERSAIDALLEMAAAYAVPRTTSGLVELQRRLRKLYS